MDELDRFRNNNQFNAQKIKPENKQRNNSALKKQANNQQGLMMINHKPKINNFALEDNTKRTGLSLAGQNVLVNISGSTSQKSESISSKNASYRGRQPARKENDLGKAVRLCGCIKIKTEENKVSIEAS